MRIAICDDEVKHISIIENYLDELKNPDIFYDVFLSGEKLISEYENNHANYDVIFLDIEMGNLDGIDTANRIRQIDRHVIIVFITSHTKYMQRSFECMPFRFLVKPVVFEDFDRVYYEICRKLKDNPGTVVFYENRNRTRIFCEDILFFESVGHFMFIHTIKGEAHKMRKTMAELLETLDNGMFVRIHRAFVVNLEHIYQVGESDVIMYHSDKAIPLSRTYKKDFVDHFLNYKERKYLL